MDDFFQKIASSEQDFDKVIWTRELVEEAIRTHNGPDRLSFAGANLANLDLSNLDLHNIWFSSFNDWAETKPPYKPNYSKRANLEGANLMGTNFSNSYLANVNLKGCILMYANFDHAILFGANLDDTIIVGTNFQWADLSNSNIRSRDIPPINDLSRYKSIDIAQVFKLSPKFQNARLEGTNFEAAYLRRANFNGAKLLSANLKRSYLEGATFENANLENADLSDLDLFDLRENGLFGARLFRAKLNGTRIRKAQLGSSVGEEKQKEFRKARDAYLSLKQSFDSQGDYEASSWAYIKERCMEKNCSSPKYAREYYGQEQLGDKYDFRLPIYHPKVLWFYVRHTLKWIGDWIVEISCGYGESYWRTIGSLFFIYLGFSLIYWLTGAITKVGSPEIGIPNSITHNLLDAMVFSLGVITTMGSENLSPRAQWVEIIMGLETLLGIGMTGLLGFVIGNRIRRS